MPPSSYERWHNKLPHEIVDVWDRWGLGTFCDGYLRVINPDDWAGYWFVCTICRGRSKCRFPSLQPRSAISSHWSHRI
ncbi:GAD-like domain-containing protein [Bifidobacterium colobi]